MHVKISDFRNIRDFELDLPDGKISFIYGVSGMGKSSLLKAISAKWTDDDIPAGSSSGDPIVLIDGHSPDYGAVRIYDESSVKELILQPIGNEIAYDALVGDETQIEKLKEEFFDRLKDLRGKLPQMIEKRDSISLLIKAFGPQGKKGVDGLSKIRKEIDSKPLGATKKALEYGAKYLGFINAGAKLPQYKLGKCPFCDRKMTAAANTRIEDLQTLTQSTLKMIADNAKLFPKLNIDEPDWTKKRSVARFEKEIAKQLEVLESLQQLIDFCILDENSLDRCDIPAKSSLSKYLYEVMPDIEPLIVDMNGKVSAYKALLGKMRTEFKKLVKNKADKLNAAISDMGIPYVISAESLDRTGKNITYQIRHIDDNCGGDRGKLLSTGEKNVIALLLFLEKKDGNLLLLDDPVSSYDGYRRGQLYKRIASQRGKTIIVCSHDQSFLKQAVVDKNKSRGANANIGRTVMFVNDGGQGFVHDIVVDDFGSLRGFVLDHVQTTESLSHYRTILNIRLLLELDGFNRLGAKKKAAWGYTSAILHRENRDEVLSYLTDRNYSEEDILSLLNESFGVRLAPLPEDYADASCENYTFFEKVLFCRDFPGIKTPTKNALNDIVHLNNNLAICLNPYSYNDYPMHIVHEVEKLAERHRALTHSC